MVPSRPSLADGLRGEDQRPQAAVWAATVSLPGAERHAALRGLRSDRQRSVGARLGRVIGRGDARSERGVSTVTNPRIGRDRRATRQIRLFAPGSRLAKYCSPEVRSAPAASTRRGLPQCLARLRLSGRAVSACLTGWRVSGAAATFSRTWNVRRYCGPVRTRDDRRGYDFVSERSLAYWLAVSARATTPPLRHPRGLRRRSEDSASEGVPKRGSASDGAHETAFGVARNPGDSGADIASTDSAGAREPARSNSRVLGCGLRAGRGRVARWSRR
jgi:hypothetical protein